jgi:ATP-dependent Clp protease adaptor protein ClpS
VGNFASTAGRTELGRFERAIVAGMPGGPNQDDRDDDDDGGVVLDEKPTTARARRWAVVFYNDDYTTKWFVVMVLERFFHMDETTATSFMMAVHNEGKGAAGIYTRDIAETKAEQVMEFAREYGMPLMVTAEPDDPPD